MQEEFSFIAETTDRADKLLLLHISALSRTRLQALIKQGHLSIDGKTITDPSEKIKIGQSVILIIPQAQDATPQPQNIPLDILYEDKDILVLNKPVGLVVHPAPGHAQGTLVNALLYHCGESLSGIGGIKRPGIVHRLDKETSGVMVVAKNDFAHNALSASFADHGREGTLERIYEALTWGVIPPTQRQIEQPIGRDGNNPEKMRVTNKGKWALTEILSSNALDPTNIMAHSIIKLFTGRTHQIRVHLNHINHPVVGDPVYASGFKTKVNLLDEPIKANVLALKRQALHAAELGFEHPTTGEYLHFKTPLPADMQNIVDSFTH